MGTDWKEKGATKINSSEALLAGGTHAGWRGQVALAGVGVKGRTQLDIKIREASTWRGREFKPRAVGM